MKKTVLIIEDDNLNRKLYSDVLHANGYDTIQSPDGLDAIQLAEEYAPDAIIMDLKLPYRSGLEITKQLKSCAHLSHIPVIAVTGLVEPMHRDMCMKSGCDAYLPKPLSIWELVRSIESWIGSADEGSALLH